MIDADIAAEALERLLSESPDSALFADGQPTSLALRLYAEHALSLEAEAAVSTALADPIHARRLDCIVAAAAARERALLRELTRDPVERGVVVSLSARADAMRYLCRSHELSVAASASPGGVLQTTDTEDLVTLKVAEVFEPSAEEGELQVEVYTFDDPRLVSARGILQVAAGSTVLGEYAFELCDRQFEGRFGIRKLPHASSAVEFRLYLCIGPE